MLLELLQIVLVGERSEQQKVRGLLEAEPLVEEPVADALDVVSAVAELSGALRLDPIDDLGPVHLGNPGQADDDPVTFGVAEAFLDVVPGIEVGGEHIALPAELALLLDIALVLAVHRLHL
jgi:hypothetical protein